MTSLTSHIKTAVNKLGKAVRSSYKTISSFRNSKSSSPNCVLVPSPLSDTPYPAPVVDGGPALFLSAVSLATYPKSSPHSYECPDPLGIRGPPQVPEERLDHDLAPVTSMDPQHTPLIDTMPSYLPSSATLLRRPGDLHILTEEELSAAIDRMLERLDGQEGQGQGRITLFPVKQPTKAVVAIVQPEPEPGVVASQGSDGLPEPCSDASELKEDKLLAAHERLSKPPPTGDHDDHNPERGDARARTSRRCSSTVQSRRRGGKIAGEKIDPCQALLSVVLWESEYGTL